jgi:hypothetical protein
MMRAEWVAVSSSTNPHGPHLPCTAGIARRESGQVRHDPIGRAGGPWPPMFTVSASPTHTAWSCHHTRSDDPPF